jgi:hypothetical protein
VLNFEQYRFTDDVTPLNADTLNAILKDIDNRLGTVEARYF